MTIVPQPRGELRLIPTAPTDAAADHATRDRIQHIDQTAQVAVTKAIACIRAGGPGEAVFALTKAGMSMARTWGQEVPPRPMFARTFSTNPKEDRS